MKLGQLIRRIEWRLFKEWRRLRLKNRDFTIIASNCNGEFLYYDMRLRFLTPTINLSFDMNDFVKMLERLPWYLEQPITPVEDSRFPFPCGMLADVEIRFNHYDSFEQGVAKWEERKTRINWDNLYIMGIDGDNCTEESLQRFDALPYAHKVIFTHVPRPDIKSAYYLRGFEDQPGVGVALYFRKQFLIRRYLDAFDYISFLNQR